MPMGPYICPILFHESERRYCNIKGCWFHSGSFSATPYRLTGKGLLGDGSANNRLFQPICHNPICWHLHVDSNSNCKVVDKQQNKPEFFDI